MNTFYVHILSKQHHALPAHTHDALFLLTDDRSLRYVTTRYYRAPEVILTWEHYSPQIDMWSFGCIMAEMVMRGPAQPLLFGRDYLDQLRKIGQLLGRPSAVAMAKLGNPQQQWLLQNVLANAAPVDFRADPRWTGADGTPPDEQAIDLIERLLVWDPDERLTAAEAIAHPYFGPEAEGELGFHDPNDCLLYTSPSPRD